MATVSSSPTHDLAYTELGFIRSPSRFLSEDTPHRHRHRQSNACVDGSPSRSDRDFAKLRSDCDFSGSVATTTLRLTSSD
ncbi:hypothetical protein TIFTF001_017727 [Ficus carica]|uniref:Uncharacterized protein n=1 Tax=Ficus carica TaxID=3494 RepID=A0AA88ACU2_FICCA|nr:hypothetical protein TIFTF001_017727 [Ficus carica]